MHRSYDVIILLDVHSMSNKNDVLWLGRVESEMKDIDAR